MTGGDDPPSSVRDTTPVHAVSLMLGSALNNYTMYIKTIYLGQIQILDLNHIQASLGLADSGT